ncbi:MAG TPA: ABC transporter permease [Devosiaceae bacterium]|jgi:peptide/nickel transport system permease protein|nr:ABC transporter permease [Devosiaceae bacterium]
MTDIPDSAEAIRRRGEGLSGPSSARIRKKRRPLNVPLTSGVALVGSVLLLGILGQVFWDPGLAFPAEARPNMPPVGATSLRGHEGTWANPLGSEGSGRDMLALLIVGAPNTLLMAVVAGAISTLIGIVLGFIAGFSRTYADPVIRLISDVAFTIPPLLILIVVQSSLGSVGLYTMAVLIALFEWPRPTRQIRAQVLSMRESGYVKTAEMSGASAWHIMFREMLPNLLPFLAASFILAVSGAVLAAIGLEVLGLGPTRIPTLGTTISAAIDGAAIFRGMWWWWAFPTLVLVILFSGLLLINIGLDTISNPRLRKGAKNP